MAVGFSFFAACILIMVGCFQVIAGLTALVKDDFYVALGSKYFLDFDITAWGWIHLVLGVIIVLAGVGIFSGAVWARSVGVALALLNGLFNFAFIPYYPLWSILIIALDVAVIWALTAHGRDIAT